MPQILAFGTSLNSQSINRALATYAASLVPGAEVLVQTPADYPLPMYSQDVERASGVPQAAHDFVATIGGADALIFSFAEHNGSYTAAFKNLLDWASRAERKLFQAKPLLLLATSPGGRGGQSVLTQAEGMVPHFGAELVGSFSLPGAGQNMHPESGEVLDEARHAQLLALTQQLAAAIP